MRQLIQLYMPERAASIRSVAHCDGLPLTARFVAEAIMGKEANTNGHNS
jgi:2-oxoglutarate ferredoxin oxidoreductase subunit alpha